MDKTANRTITTFRVDFVAAVSLISLTFLFATTLVTDTASAVSHTLSLTSSGAQSINATGAGGAVISSDSINVVTTCKSGYNFTINTSVNDNNLYLGGDASKNESGKYFTPADGTTTLANSTNTWGYYYNATSPSTTPTSSNIFSPVPTLNSPATVISPRATPSSTDINDNFNIYYGVSVSPSMPVGTYKMIPEQKTVEGTEILVDGTIVYTATIAEACTKYTVHFDPSSYFEGNLITGTGTMSDQSIFEGVATALTNNSFTAPTISGTQYYFAGWNTAQDGSGTTYTDGQSVTDLVATGNTITLYAMWTDCPGGKICYFANADNVEGEMGNQTIISTDTSAILRAPNYKYDGYGFASWNTEKDGTGTNYGPNQIIEFTAGQYDNNGLKLHATWVASVGNLQNWTCPNDTDMPIGTVTALKDTRDNNVYTVAKLADGRCWMVDNLRLADKDANDNDIILSSSNTHNPSLPLTNIYDTGVTSNHLSPNSSIAYDAITAPEGWCTTVSADCFDQSRVRTDNTILFTDNTSSNYKNSGNVYRYGNYYNWYSATAGHGKYDMLSGNTTGDICPAGWHLPTGGSATSEFGVLDVAMGGTGDKQASAEASNRWRTYPNNFVFSGAVDGESIEGRGTRVRYWSSTAKNTSAYYLYFNRENLSPGNGNDPKRYGFSVRCISDT